MLITDEHIIDRLVENSNYKKTHLAKDGSGIIEYEVISHRRAIKFARALLADAALTAQGPQVAWRCFHCDEVFSDRHAAQMHFGYTECSDPACLIKAGAEKSMLEALRRAEADTEAATAAMHNESSEGWRAYHNLSGRVREQVEAAENLGYERGLRDARSAIVETAQPVAVPDGWQPTHRHRKRGSTYTVIEEGRLQVDGDLDNERVVIYRSEDGHVWARPKYEFEDGRFEALPPAPANGGEHG